jgi:hypothetical protein
MSTYSASHRVNSSGHPLDGRLEGYLRGLVPRVPWIGGYGPTILDMAQFLLLENDWGSKYIVPDMGQPLLTEGEGPPT